LIWIAVRVQARTLVLVKDVARPRPSQQHDSVALQITSSDRLGMRSGAGDGKRTRVARLKGWDAIKGRHVVRY